VPYLSASAVVIHYEEALYQVHGPSPFTFLVELCLYRFLWGCQLGRVCQSSKQSILRSEWSRGTWWRAWGRVFTITVCNVTPFCFQSTLECRSSYEREKGGGLEREPEPETESFNIRALMLSVFVISYFDSFIFRFSHVLMCYIVLTDMFTHCIRSVN